MEYDELSKIWSNKISLYPISKQPLIMSIADFMNDLFWRGSAQAGYDRWEDNPTGQGHKDIWKWKDSSIDFTLEGRQYKMKVVEAYNQNIKAGEKLWWITKEYTDPSVPAPPKEWQYATVIEMTREGDPDVLRIYQTYGEPHGVWEWDLQKFGNPAAINYLHLK